MIYRLGRQKVWCLLLAVVMSMLAGCVVLSRQEANELATRIRQTHGYARRIDSSISSQLSEVVNESARTRANTEAVLDELRTELLKTQGVVETNTVRLSELSRKIDGLRENLYRKLGIVAGGAVPMPSGPPIAPSPEGAAPSTLVPSEQTPPPLAPPSIPATATPAEPREEPPRAVITSAVSPQNDYQRAYRDYQRGNYELAKLGFRQYLSSYPDSDDADNAQFWLAQCYYKMGDNETALAETHRLYRDFPQSDKIPDAMLIESFIEIEQGNQARARAILEKLIADYPTTEPAKRGKLKLDAMSSGSSG